MDISKVGNCKSISYRLTAKDAVQLRDVVSNLQSMQDAGKLGEFNTLQFLGMLWMEIETARIPRVPKTLAERKWYLDYSKQMDKAFTLHAGGTQLDHDIDLHVEMLKGMRRAMMALLFNCMSEETLANLNERYTEAESGVKSAKKSGGEW